jgi:hypothetical protein
MTEVGRRDHGDATEPAADVTALFVLRLRRTQRIPCARRVPSWVGRVLALRAPGRGGRCRVGRAGAGCELGLGEVALRGISDGCARFVVSNLP